ncbi:MAG: hypothetical protein KZQ93_16200 [Candidatus Thiodiazotropha sp. (ex Monitilora ramsayi)]|nr:hypothetical protein [Candidatus Thiodiazotropha sp. (ex Monitilora ramsayi)]
MKSITICCLLCIVAVTGCTRAMPLISHAHVGHSLTAWRDTPGQEGLFVVAEKETGIALENAKAAIDNQANAPRRLRHLSNVVHALNPDHRESGDGLGYGAIRALDGSVDHMVFAAESEDASDNLIRMSARFAEGASRVSDRLRLAGEIAMLAENATDEESGRLLKQLEQVLNHALEGADLNDDGRVDNRFDEYGLLQLRNDISRSLHKEKPPYQPAGKKYLLGLVRLPGGSWAYRFDLTDKNAPRPWDGYGYGY